MKCPRCHGDNAKERGFFLHWVFCEDCGLITMDSYKTKEEALEAWEAMDVGCDNDDACDINL